MDVAAFQSLYPEEVRIQSGRTNWFGSNLQYYNAKSGTWYDMAPSAQAQMFKDELMNFETIDGLVKSSIISNRQFAIIVEGSLLGFIRGNNLQTEEDEEMNIEIDWEMDVSMNNENYETPDIFSPEDELKKLL